MPCSYRGDVAPPELPAHTLNVTLIGLRMLNNLATLDLKMLQVCISPSISTTDVHTAIRKNFCNSTYRKKLKCHISLFFEIIYKGSVCKAKRKYFIQCVSVYVINLDFTVTELNIRIYLNRIRQLILRLVYTVCVTFCQSLMI